MQHGRGKNAENEVDVWSKFLDQIIQVSSSLEETSPVFLWENNQKANNNSA